MVKSSALCLPQGSLDVCCLGSSHKAQHCRQHLRTTGTVGFMICPPSVKGPWCPQGCLPVLWHVLSLAVKPSIYPCLIETLLLIIFLGVIKNTCLSTFLEMFLCSFPNNCWLWLVIFLTLSQNSIAYTGPKLHRSRKKQLFSMQDRVWPSPSVAWWHHYHVALNRRKPPFKLFVLAGSQPVK